MLTTWPFPRHSEDDDDEPEAENAKEPVPDGMDVDEKPAEEGAPAPEEPAPAKPKRSANQELEIFSDDELEELDVNILKADVANLEGALPPCSLPMLPSRGPQH